MAEDWVQVLGGAEVLSRVKVPRQGIDRVYKDECMFSFDTPESETGLYVSLASFWGLGRDHVEAHYRKTGNPIFLHIRRIKKKVPKTVSNEGPDKKITRLAIGVEGGFDDGQNFTYESEEFFQLAVLPSFRMIQLPNDQLPPIVLDSITAIQTIESASKLAELEAMSATWDGEVRQKSKHSTTLVQLDNGKKIPPRGWKCEAPDCDLTTNLWLNLSDGTILCGRKFFDGSGGNNHAMEHYAKFKHPLAVKLGTITPDGRADVYSYDEDDMVEDTKLVEHLAHFGINVAAMEKTDKSMAEMEIELNQRQGEWDTIQEAGKKLKPLFGPGFTGLVNLGNTCYLNSIMQILFSIPQFEQRFRNNASKYFESSSDPVNDFNVQMAKMCVGLLSGKYSQCKERYDDEGSHRAGISPLMFRTLIGKGHVEFSTKKQQDAQEFFLHLLSALEKNSLNDLNPADCFKFQVEGKLICKKTGRVRFSHRMEYCVPLRIPMERATNTAELKEYEERKKLAEANGQKLPPESLVRPKIPLDACIQDFLAQKEVECRIPSGDLKNLELCEQQRMSTFPDYLAIQLQKFTLSENWTPIKLDVSVDMPDDLDITCLRAQGLQPGEVLIPEEKEPEPPVDENVVRGLIEMGFNPNASRKAVIVTGNKGLETAAEWMMMHLDDPDLNTPYAGSSSNGQVNSNWIADEAGVQSIEAMGFTSEQAKKGLRATDNNVERAVDWIFSHRDELDNVAPAVGASPSKPSNCTDGPGKYKLLGFVSHMGTSTMVGHYVCHIRKDGKWAIFNDEKVAESENLPKDLGYLYFYKRV